MTREYLKLEAQGASFEELEKLTLGGLRKAVVEGDTDQGSVLAGQIAGMVNRRQSCREIIDEIMGQAETLLKLR
jgi:enoyl-[acyl-carrier protein] reductase II